MLRLDTPTPAFVKRRGVLFRNANAIRMLTYYTLCESRHSEEDVRASVDSYLPAYLRQDIAAGVAHHLFMDHES
jgi:hypothetical protein